jgi:putative heme-binding domain-containing protein
MHRFLALLAALFGLPHPAPAAEPFRLLPGDTVALVGGSNFERTRFHGHLQARLVAAVPDGRVRVRNFGWEGDTVFEPWREGADSASWRQQRDWRDQLAAAGVTVVLAQFGQMESLAGEARLPKFLAAYEALLGELGDDGRRVVVVSPVPFEGRLESRNPDLLAYARATADLAARLGWPHVDLTAPMLAPDGPPHTDNGHQLHEPGHRLQADLISRALGLPDAAPEPVRREILELERLWFDFWRPMNWSFLAGDRTHVPYSKDWRDAEKRIFPEEMKDFEPLLRQADENVWRALAGQPPVPVGVRSRIPEEPPSEAPQSPDEELAGFRVQDGFRVNLFASEADGLVKPIQMRWDERGRLWVACTVSYPQIKPGERADDYILVCEDTDRDGKADRFHRFAEGLFMPSGLELGDGGLYVAQGTELLHLRDTDGDGRADERRIVLGGFGTGDSHQMINGLNWGFGGELWFTQGHHIYSRVETPHGVETLNRAGVWRYRPRTGHLDPFFQWSSAGANCWGVVTTDHGQPFHKSGANVGGYFSTPGLVRSDLAVNAQAMNLFLAPIKQVGMEFVGSSHFPPEMQGRVVIGGYYGNTLEQHELTLENGLWRSSLLPDLITTPNRVFRPVEIRGGPDGALYVADWYNPIIGHYQASYRHPDRDKAHGRIWRLTRTDRPLVTPPVLAGTSVPDLLEHLDSPERWTKYQVKRLLFGHDTQEVVPALDTWLASPRSDYRRLQALALYEAHETPRPALLQALLRSDDARIRAYATRVLSTWARDGHLPDALAWLEPQIADADPLVRLEAIVAASYLPDPRAATLAARALDHPFNDYHHHALTKTLHATRLLWVPPLLAGTLDFARDEHLVFALTHGWVENNPEDFRNLSGAPVRYQPTSAGSQARVLMRDRAARFADQPARRDLWLKALAAIAAPEDVAFLLEHAAATPDLLALLRNAPDLRTPPQDAAPLLGPLVAHADPSVSGSALRLAGHWNLAAFRDPARSLALDATADPARRASALAALGDFGGPDASATLRQVLADPAAASLHVAALEALLVRAPGEAVTVALQRIGGTPPPADVLPWLTPLLNRTQAAAALREALQRPDALPPPAAKLVLQSLNRLGRSDAKLTPLLMKLAGLDASLPPYTPEAVAKFVAAARTLGDAAEGRLVYEQAGCTACHLPGAPGSKIGPDLSALSRGLPLDLIVTELVWPALNVKEGYEAATVTLRDGTVVTGFKHSETADEIAVRDVATGTVRTLRRADAASVQSGGTVMPDGLLASLTERQLASLIRYLGELGK